jgi:hypothetical protein
MAGPTRETKGAYYYETAAGGACVVSAGYDHHIYIFDMLTGDKLERFHCEMDSFSSTHMYESATGTLRFLAGSLRGVIRVVDLGPAPIRSILRQAGKTG